VEIAEKLTGGGLKIDLVERERLTDLETVGITGSAAAAARCISIAAALGPAGTAAPGSEVLRVPPLKDHSGPRTAENQASSGLPTVDTAEDPIVSEFGAGR